MKLAQRRYGEAESLLREALHAYEKTNSDGWKRYYTQSMLGASVAGLGKYAQAEPLLISGYQRMAKRQDSIPSENSQVLDDVRGWIGQLYQRWGKPNAAMAQPDRVIIP